MESEEASDCARCHSKPAPHGIRGDRLCRDCFDNWLFQKVSKRMESFRVAREETKKVLLPISFGCCSLSLLALLDRHLKRQRERTQRVGYEIKVLHVLGAGSEEDRSLKISKLERLRQLFPEHQFSYVSLEDEMFNNGGYTLFDETCTDETRISLDLISTLSVSGREDMIQILSERLILAEARKHSCTSILFADTTTRLSERVLAETAKGRGFALPQLIGENSVRKDISYLYPLRDLFRKEIDEYARHILPDVCEIMDLSSVDSRAASSRSMTIDKLMAQYVTELEITSPSIVTNVLRTSAKLVQPQRNINCQLCGLSLDEGTVGLHGWGGDQAIELDRKANFTKSGGQDSSFCYGCTRSAQGG